MPLGISSVLYTSLTAECAKAELAFHFSLLDPAPTKPVAVHSLEVQLKQVITIERGHLKEMGVVDENYSDQNYSVTQNIGAAAQFLGFTGIIVPSARSVGDNIVLFGDNLSETCAIRVTDTAGFDWREHVKES